VVEGNGASLPDLYGDCKNFVLCKCWRLRELGVACEIVIYWEPAVKDFHAVAFTDGWVLDSRRRHIRRWVPPAGGWWVRFPLWGRSVAPVVAVGQTKAAEIATGMPRANGKAYDVNNDRRH
jgi:hypothetical protein